MGDAVPFHGLTPRFFDGVLEIPVYHMRGGTSTGILLYEPHLPEDLALREELVRHIMGVPLAGEVAKNAQITGLGRGIPQSCKVFIVDRAERADADIQSTLAQLAPTKAAIDWSVNCGNMSAALPVFAAQVGLVSLVPGTNRVRIFNTNTGVVTHALLDMPEPDQPVSSETEIPGVMGQWPGVQLALLEPVGAKTGRLLPTGNVTDEPRWDRRVLRRSRRADGDRPCERSGQDCRGIAGSPRRRPGPEGATAAYLGCGGAENGPDGQGRRADDRSGVGSQRDDPKNLHRRTA